MSLFRCSPLPALLLATLTFVSPSRLNAEPPELDRFGGTLAVTTEATGHFRTEKIHGRWFFITPDGHPYIALGANHVGSYLKTQAEAGGLFQRFADDPERAAEALVQNLRDLGLTAGDAYQPDARFAERLPWVLSFHYLPGEGGKQPPNVFDEAEMQTMHDFVSARCATTKDNPWVIGVAGPDLPKWDSSYVHPYRIAPAGSTARQGYETFLRDRHADDIASLNVAYGTKFPSWDALTGKPRLNFKIDTDAAHADENAFLALIAEKHFAAVRTACKARAPHHLYLGERTQLRTIPDAVLEAMGRHIDVFCTQSLIRLPQTPPEWQIFQRTFYDHEYALVKKPMVIIDWAAPFSLGNAPEPTEYGTLKPEPQAAADAARFIHNGFKPRYMIGLFICQVIGTHPNDKFFTNAKRTYLRDDGTPFPTRTNLLRSTNRALIEHLYEEAAISPQ